ncbi:MAG: HAMP domain-containing histidine kinase [Chitinophagales bacterium]|nr:HAMP domain-containing histidine kinase [Chitinophagales bacterium]
MEITAQPLLEQNERTAPFEKRFILPRKQLLHALSLIQSIGISAAMEEYDQRKLRIFNQINFFQLLSGFLFPVTGLLMGTSLPPAAWVIAALPALVSGLVLYLNYINKQELALLAYFILYPFFTCVVYLYGFNPGISLSFILFGILSVFFLNTIGQIVFSLGFSMVSYFFLAVVIRQQPYELREVSNGLYLLNQGVSLLFIFYGLFLIKKENGIYQTRILAKNSILEEKNTEIRKQSHRLEESAALLKQQASQLSELNTVKTKLFSIISHDLKAPMYAIRNLFKEAHEQKLSAAELQATIPDVLNDMNYAVGLMENLLQWARAQMQAHTVNPEVVDIEESINDVYQALLLTARNKGVILLNDAPPKVYGFCDKDMMNLVMRNLLSNAIKFTPEKGKICIGVHEHPSFLEIYVQDSGMGMSQEDLMRIRNNDYFTTKGTASESGTGLGLMLCKEFLVRNGGQLYIESEPGQGSTFSFSVPKPVFG